MPQQEQTCPLQNGEHKFPLAIRRLTFYEQRSC